MAQSAAQKAAFQKMLSARKTKPAGQATPKKKVAKAVAKKAKAAPKTYKGKSLKPGGGGQFAKAVDAMKSNGLPQSEAQAIAAKQGRAKYGATKMAAFATAGRKRAAKKKAAKKK